MTLKTNQVKLTKDKLYTIERTVWDSYNDRTNPPSIMVVGSGIDLYVSMELPSTISDMVKIKTAFTGFENMSIYPNYLSFVDTGTSNMYLTSISAVEVAWKEA